MAGIEAISQLTSEAKAVLSIETLSKEQMSSKLRMPMWKVSFYRRMLGLTSQGTRMVGIWYHKPKSLNLRADKIFEGKEYCITERTPNKLSIEFR